MARPNDCGGLLPEIVHIAMVAYEDESEEPPFQGTG